MIILKIKFNDNDFGECVYDACALVMKELSDHASKPTTMYNRLKKEHGIENIRQSVVIATYGFYVTGKMRTKLLFSINYVPLEDKKTFDYLNTNITIEEIASATKKWENGEVCYMNLTTGKVWRQ